MLSRPNDNTLIKEIKRKSFDIRQYTITDDEFSEITDVLEDQWGLYDCEYGSIDIGKAQIYDTYTSSYYYVMCNSATIYDWSIFLQAYNREFCNEFNTFKEFALAYKHYNNRKVLRSYARHIVSTLRIRRRMSIYN